MSVKDSGDNNQISRRRPINIVILGLENAGKTTLLNRIIGKEVPETFTTIGMNVENIEKDGLLFQTIDLGGQRNFRESLWPHYTTLAKCAIFVFDIMDKRKLHDAKLWFDSVSRWISGDAILCFFANKTDLRDETEEYLTMDTIVKQFQLEKIASFPNRSFRIFETSALTGENIDTSMNWIFSKLSESIRKESRVSFIYIFDKNDNLIYENSIDEDGEDIKNLLTKRISNMRDLKASYNKLTTKEYIAQLMVGSEFSLSIGSRDCVSEEDLFTASVSLSELLVNEFHPIEEHLDQLETIVNISLIQNLNFRRK